MSLAEAGSTVTRSAFSFGVSIKYPPSLGIEPKTIGGTEQIGDVRAVTTVSVPTTKYGLMFIAPLLIDCFPSAS